MTEGPAPSTAARSPSPVNGGGKYLYTLEEIDARLIGRAAALCSALFGATKTHGNQIWMKNPGRTDANWTSFSLNLATGVWRDFATGQGGKGCLSLIAEFACSGDWKRAVPWAKDFLGLTGKAPDPAEARRIIEKQKRAEEEEKLATEKRRKGAWALWSQGAALTGHDPASLYLAGRGIALNEWPGVLRFHPECLAYPEGTKHPAMLALVSREGLPHGFATVHRTYLEQRGGQWVKAAFPLRDGRRPSAKRVMCPYGGGTIRLTRGVSGQPLRQAPEGEWPGVSEGIENALTGAVALPNMRWLAAVSIANLGGVLLPAQIGGVFVLKDNDADPKAQAQFANAIDRLRERHEVMIGNLPEMFKDANDALRGIKREGAA